MLNRIREARKNESGFTLIELLIVIVILGVLAGIVVFAVSAFNKDGQASACKADVKNVEIASEAYFAKNAKYATAVDGTATTTLVGGGYLKEAPATSNAAGTTLTPSTASYGVYYGYVDATTSPTIKGFKSDGSAC
jgi:prepilin-type N-terminal cleavage/methylation domain-containing protein